MKLNVKVTCFYISLLRSSTCFYHLFLKTCHTYGVTVEYIFPFGVMGFILKNIYLFPRE